VNNSDEKSVIKGKTIYLGFELINQLEKAVVEKITAERQSGGDYTSLYNFVKRSGISIEQLRILIRAGAFRFLNDNKKELLWQAHMLISPLKPRNERTELFDVEPQQYTLPKLENTWEDDAYDEIELLGFSLCSPFKLLKEPVKNSLLSADLKKSVGKIIEIVGYLVNVKTTYTSNGQKMFFGTFLDQAGQWIDTVHFPPSAAAHPFTGPGIYSITGKVTEEFDFVCIDVSYQKRYPFISRDDDNGLKPFSRANKDRVYQGRR
jgi:DNA polymerase-3 subunit alpha